MNGRDPVNRRRVVFAQGAAALACFVVVHGAHAATRPLGKHAQIYPHIVETDTLLVPGSTLDHLLDGLGLRGADFNLMTVDVQGG